MNKNNYTLENKLHEKISLKGELAFWYVPGAMLLDARKDDRENNVQKSIKPTMYIIASLIETEKLVAYSGILYGLYQLAEKLF